MEPLFSKQTGFSLIEVMVAAAIFSMGLAGLSMLLLTAVMGTAEAGHHTVASTKASSLAEMIALNPDALGHYINPQALEDYSCLDGEGCSGGQLAAEELGAWQRDLAAELPRGRGLVCRDSTPDDGYSADAACDGEGGMVVKVFWLESRHINDEDGGLRRLVARLSL
jgi:type IV pilus assembly protein PilV